MVMRYREGRSSRSSLLCLGIVSAEHERKENCLAPSHLSSHSTTRGKDDQKFIIEACIPAGAFSGLPRSVLPAPTRKGMQGDQAPFKKRRKENHETAQHSGSGGFVASSLDET